MLDEKLNALIEKYGVYDSIGGIQKHRTQRGFLYKKIIQPIKQIIGTIRLAMALNAELDKVPENDTVALWTEGKSRGLYWFWLLAPRNQKKVHYLIRDGKDNIKKSYYHGRTVLTSLDIKKTKIQTIILMHRNSAWLANLLQNFSGGIIAMQWLIFENHLVPFLWDTLQPNLYADIFIARHMRNTSNTDVEKRVWNQRLIAHYLMARDFLNAKKEVEDYIKKNYENAEIYRAFWHDMEILFHTIKEALSQRKQRDVFVHWLDAMEKEDFYSMQWLGNPQNGISFHRAYTTMVYTTSVLRSIFTGKNVKAGRLSSLKILNVKDTVFSEYPLKNFKVHAFMCEQFHSKLGDSILTPLYKEYSGVVPAMIWLWHLLDMLLDTSRACVILLHYFEVHNYLCGELPFQEFPWPLDDNIILWKDCAENARLCRTYLDQELEWYHKLFPATSVSIYMSDHGRERNLTEQNINMPFKIMGKDVLAGNENRLFSYKDIHKLIKCFLQNNDNFDEAFENHVIIDTIDPYDQSFSLLIREQDVHNYVIERKKVDKEELKKYIQATKVVTAEGEYYTINILGEEMYYRDKECKINLIDDPAYAERIAELREKAGKFYNPWKEKRQVAIDFYEYLGIEEKDILAQCY